MGLIAPNLDDRKFQDLVDEAKRMIPRFCPEWTDHNVSDPGVTLIELFAWMTEAIIYRLNKVTDRNYIKYLDLIGVRLLPPTPARADVTFRLAAPQPDAVVIPKGTEVATERTSSTEAITFTLDRDLEIVVPHLTYCLVTRDEAVYHDYMPALRNPALELPIFQDVPEPDDAMYLGYGENLSGLVLALTLQCKIEGIGVDPKNPPLAWEFWNDLEGHWAPLLLESDSTGGLNRNGAVILHMPYVGGYREVGGRRACWIRCRATRPRSGQQGYSSSPRVHGCVTQSIGGMVPASHVIQNESEVLGRSDGTPGQAFALHNAPVLARMEGETLEVEGESEEEYERWQEVEDFGASGPNDPHFTMDSVSGEIRFGPSIRQPDGSLRQYGRVPPQGKRIRFISYRSGGGTLGNVGQGTIKVLKDSIPYVSSVVNLRTAIGGIDAESLECAKLRGPQVIKARNRAVTAEDYEFLARQATSGIARVRCLFPTTADSSSVVRAGSVMLLLVPAITAIDGPIPVAELALADRLRQEVQAYLDERRLLSVELTVAAPRYAWVAVNARIKAKRRAQAEQIRQEAERALYRFINPVVGGPDGQGWPFGRDLFLSEVYSALQAVNGVEYVDQIELSVVDSQTGERTPAGQRVQAPTEGLICSHQHQITVT